jgi:uncharacterized membrane protein YkvA (DUF1232 family)
MSWNKAPALSFQEHERTVIRDFWTALKQFAGRLPFVEDLVAAYYCALDPATPMRVRGILLAACLLYLSMALSTADIALAWARIYG